MFTKESTPSSLRAGREQQWTARGVDTSGSRSASPVLTGLFFSSSESETNGSWTPRSWNNSSLGRRRREPTTGLGCWRSMRPVRCSRLGFPRELVVHMLLSFLRLRRGSLVPAASVRFDRLTGQTGQV